ncbi:9969_t:CDS:2 [Acaulospora colombiana]|uniref:9969_t:CDS:1 n=1 Tax=Acaulospora colombiana TaxID=27376 RepID=A0ACA9KXD7_9GLOM|nr:9969_t:CDS:2 [Acaulospora colombiana]
MSETKVKKFWVFIKNTPRVIAVKVPLTETAEAIIAAAQTKYGPEISQHPLVELTLVDSKGKIVDPTMDIEEITSVNSRDEPFEIKILDIEGKFVEEEDVQIFVLVKYEGEDVYYPTAATLRSQYDVDQFLMDKHFQSVDHEGRPTGYAVIFMHRQFSLQPYSRRYIHSINCFLDFMELKNDGISPDHVREVRFVLERYKLTKKNETLLLLDFVTVTDYLFLLRGVTNLMSDLNEHAIYYLAAAVSDFFIPDQKMVQFPIYCLPVKSFDNSHAQHKIQSGEGALTLRMDQVPKFLKPMVTNWVPRGFIVSFKLETDPNLLIDKSRHALTRYGHQIVIGNLLETRKAEVIFITKDTEFQLKLTDDEIAHGMEIESKIVPELVKRHDEWIRISETIISQK